jgi:hypothetical protein
LAIFDAVYGPAYGDEEQPIPGNNSGGPA